MLKFLKPPERRRKPVPANKTTNPGAVHLWTVPGFLRLWGCPAPAAQGGGVDC